MLHTKNKKHTSAAKARIRVIKRAEIGGMKRPVSADKQLETEETRQMVATVLNWVSDLEARKLDETSLAVAMFRQGRLTGTGFEIQ